MPIVGTPVGNSTFKKSLNNHHGLGICLKEFHWHERKIRWKNYLEMLNIYLTKISSSWLWSLKSRSCWYFGGARLHTLNEKSIRFLKRFFSFWCEPRNNVLVRVFSVSFLFKMAAEVSNASCGSAHTLIINHEYCCLQSTTSQEAVNTAARWVRTSNSTHLWNRTLIIVLKQGVPKITHPLLNFWKINNWVSHRGMFVRPKEVIIHQKIS